MRRKVVCDMSTLSILKYSTCLPANRLCQQGNKIAINCNDVTFERNRKARMCDLFSALHRSPGQMHRINFRAEEMTTALVYHDVPQNQLGLQRLPSTHA